VGTLPDPDPLPAGGAAARPYLPGDDTVARIIGVHHDQAGDLDLFQNQAGKRKAAPGLAGAQWAGLAYLRSIYQKLGVTSRSQAIQRAVDLRLL
jgi:hypothetical protein